MGLFCLTHMFVFPEGAPHSCPYCKVDYLRAGLAEAVSAISLCQTALHIAMEGRGYSGRELEALGAAKRVLDKHETKS